MPLPARMNAVEITAPGGPEVLKIAQRPMPKVGDEEVLIEVAAGFEDGSLDPFEIVERTSVEPVAVGGVWQHLQAPALPLCDLAVLTAATGTPLPRNASSADATSE